ncbi:antirestriction protein ArdA [Staphylococcus delphini]|uniref:Antirestriction protein n=1 Tax=Staphylococcus delphini TaxID=53344 RepID=A0AAX0QTF8_9STAP|nr:antirestriction protein ArdA [Staphylococcus delphini]PCF50152.1 hypothetical protein B5C07_08060 [Staphylococcus delphini]PNZ87890.1 antirestriction protein ArdA [Staphylococcus delphini]RIZ56216.1 hypothetical protein CDL68_01365 [Staphylococcus delphini]VED62442.1 putative antirestriction protein [Staphylococcus delphini]
MENKQNENKIQFNLFISDLTEYNAGNLVGKWFDALTEFDAMSTYINTIAGKGNEWFISDSESDLLEVSEFHSIDDIGEMVKVIKKATFDSFVATKIKGEYENADIIKCVENNRVLILDCDVSAFEALGYYEVETSYFEEIRLDNEFISSYFDFESLGRDLLWSGEYTHIGRDDEHNHIFIINF